VLKLVIVLVLALAIAGCATHIVPQKAPLLSPFGDGTQWIVWEDIVFEVELDDHTKTSIVVPRGFVTDLASTPPELWSIYPPFGKYLSAAILHDYLYWRQMCSPRQADQIIYQTMRDAGVDQATQSRFYLALEKKGHKAWTINQDERASGLVRVIPEKYLSPSAGMLTPNTLWPQLRLQLKSSGVAEVERADGQQIASACSALGKEIKVKSNISAVLWGR
jgi:hypothetical protein